jgi:hypothetical protein
MVLGQNYPGWGVLVGDPHRQQPWFSVVALGKATQWQHVVMGAPPPKPRDEWPPGTVGWMVGTVGDRVPTVGQIVARNLEIQRLRMQSENHRKN